MRKLCTLAHGYRAVIRNWRLYPSSSHWVAQMQMTRWSLTDLIRKEVMISLDLQVPCEKLSTAGLQSYEQRLLKRTMLSCVFWSQFTNTFKNFLTIMIPFSKMYQKTSMDLASEDSSTQPFLLEDSENKTRKSSHSNQLSGVILAVVIITTLLSTIGTIILFSIYSHDRMSRSSSSAVMEQVLECGTSKEEAMARGCEFDIMNYAWTPTPCYNRTLSDQYWRQLVQDDIKFYEDASRSKSLSYQEILAAKHEYTFTSWKLHLKHCEYLIHRQLQSLTYATPVDNLMRNLSHAEHCLEEVRSPSDQDTVLYTGTTYLRCASGTGYIGPLYWNQPPDSVRGRPFLL